MSKQKQPPKEEDESDEISGITTIDPVVEYLTKCGLPSTSEFSVEDIDESSVALITGLSNLVKDENNSNGKNDIPNQVVSTFEKQNKKQEKEIIAESQREDLKKSSEIKKKSEEMVTDTTIVGEKLQEQPVLVSDKKPKIQSLYRDYTSCFSSKKYRDIISTSQDIDLTGNAGCKFASQELPQIQEDSAVKDYLKDLEPWQIVLFEKLEQHEEALLKCHAQMDATAKLLAAVAEQRDDYIRALEDFVQHSTQAQTKPFLRRRQRDDPKNTNVSGQEGGGVSEATVQPQGPEPPPQPHFLILPLLEYTAGKILHFPRKLYNYLKVTRLVRLINLIHIEAENHHMPGGPNARFLDWNLIFKIFFVCFLFGARMNAKTVTKRNDTGNSSWLEKFISIWQTFRVHIFVLSALTTYVIQTGLGQFLYRIFVKEKILLRVWRDEDLLEKETVEKNVTQKGERAQLNAGVHGQANQQQDGVRGGDGIGNLVADRRGNKGGSEIFQQFQDTFLTGVVAQPQINRNANVAVRIHDNYLHRIVDFFRDIMYLFGSILLSLFPMWRPRVRIVPPHPVHLDMIDDGSAATDLNQRVGNNHEALDSLVGHRPRNIEDDVNDGTVDELVGDGQTNTEEKYKHHATDGLVSGLKNVEDENNQTTVNTVGNGSRNTDDGDD